MKPNSDELLPLIIGFDKGEEGGDYSALQIRRGGVILYTSFNEVLIEAFSQLTETRPTPQVSEGLAREIIEIYAGMDGFVPETAPEAYQERIIKQMYEAALAHKED